MAKITKATFKKFIRENRSNLLILVKSEFDGMIDGCRSTGDKMFSPIVATDHPYENNLGLCGVWLVGGSRDYFTEVDEPGYRGISVYNCCGSFSVAVKV